LEKYDLALWLVMSCHRSKYVDDDVTV